MSLFVFFFFNDTATTEIYTLSLHDALPISGVTITFPPSMSGDSLMSHGICRPLNSLRMFLRQTSAPSATFKHARSEEHTSELQSRLHLVCRLLLEKKKES